MDGWGRLCHCLMSLRLDSCQIDPHILGTSLSQDFFCSPTEFPLRCGLVKLPQALKMIVSTLLSLLPQAMLCLLCCGSVMSKASFHKITFKQSLLPGHCTPSQRHGTSRCLSLCRTFQNSTRVPVLLSKHSWHVGEDSFSETLLKPTAQGRRLQAHFQDSDCDCLGLYSAPGIVYPEAVKMI